MIKTDHFHRDHSKRASVLPIPAGSGCHRNVHLMRRKRGRRLSRLLLLFLITAVLAVHAGGQNVSAVKAMQLFDSGNYAEAETLFQNLLEEDPANPMLNYYYGAVRTENGHFGEDELSFLLKAGKNITPDRLHYYLGMQHHARNNWEQALKHYNQFKLSVPEEEQQRWQLAQKIQHCFDHVNPYGNEPVTSKGEPEQGAVAEQAAEIYRQGENAVPAPDNEAYVKSADEQETVTAEKEGVAEQQTREGKKEARQDQPEAEPAEAQKVHDTTGTPGDVPLDELLADANAPKTNDQVMIRTERELLPDLPGVEPTYPVPSGEQIEFQVDDQITYLFSSQFQTTEGEQLYEKGRSLQKKMNRRMREADELREQYRNTADTGEKAEIGEKILSGESAIYQLQEEVSQLFSASRKEEKAYWNQAGAVERHNFIVKLDKIKAGLEKSAEEADSSPSRHDTVPLELSESLQAFYGLNTGNQKRRQDEKLVYKIQIGAYSRGVPAYKKRLFDKLSLIRRIESYTDENGVAVYTTGNLRHLKDALKMQSQVRQEGVKDAFVVPYFNGKRITLEQAKKIEAGDDIKGD